MGRWYTVIQYEFNRDIVNEVAMLTKDKINVIILVPESNDVSSGKV